MPSLALAFPTRHIVVLHYPRFDGGRKVRSVRVIAGLQLPSSSSHAVPLRAVADFPMIGSRDIRNGFHRFVFLKGSLPEKAGQDDVEQGIWGRYYVEYEDRPGVFEEKQSPLNLASQLLPAGGPTETGKVNFLQRRLLEVRQELCSFPPEVSQVSSMVSYRCTDPGNRYCPEAERELAHPCFRDLAVFE